MSDAVIFGSKGMLARAVAAELKATGLEFVGYDLPECDLGRSSDVAAIFQKHQPRIVYNCAAFTKVDLCEEQPDLADNVNGYCVATLAKMSREFGAKLIHISTDFVFDGNGTAPYQPCDTPSPLSAYGRSKLLGEKLLMQVNPAGYAIVRTAWLYGVGGLSFPRTMVEVARQGKPLRVVSDQVGCPTYTGDLAKAIVALSRTKAQGIFHCTNAGPTNWYEFARETLEQFKVPADLKPISSDEYKKMRPKSAHRPSYSVLDCTSLESAIGQKMRPWQEALADFVQAVNANGGF